MEKTVNDERRTNWDEEETSPYDAIVSAVKDVLELYNSEPSRSFGGVRSAQEYSEWHHEDGRVIVLQLADDIARKIDNHKESEQYKCALTTVGITLQTLLRKCKRSPTESGGDLRVALTNTCSAVFPLCGFFALDLFTVHIA